MPTEGPHWPDHLTAGTRIAHCNPGRVRNLSGSLQVSLRFLNQFPPYPTHCTSAIGRSGHPLDKEQPIGTDVAKKVQAALVGQKMIDSDDRIQPAFDPKRADFKLEMPESHKDMIPAVVGLLASYQIERHIRKARDRQGGGRKGRGDCDRGHCR